MSVEKLSVIPKSFVGTSGADLCLELSHLQFDPFGVGITFAMVLCDDVASLFTVSVGEEPARRLW